MWVGFCAGYNPFMKDPLQPDRCARLLSALAAPQRLQIVRFLRDGPRNVTEIAAMLKEQVVNVSHHLMVLRNARLIRGKKQGRHVLYSLVPGLLLPDTESGDQLNLGCCKLEMPRPEVPPPSTDRIS